MIQENKFPRLILDLDILQLFFTLKLRGLIGKGARLATVFNRSRCSVWGGLQSGAALKRVNTLYYICVNTAWRLLIIDFWFSLKSNGRSPTRRRGLILNGS